MKIEVGGEYLVKVGGLTNVEETTSGERVRVLSVMEDEDGIFDTEVEVLTGLDAGEVYEAYPHELEKLVEVGKSYKVGPMGIGGVESSTINETGVVEELFMHANQEGFREFLFNMTSGEDVNITYIVNTSELA